MKVVKDKDKFYEIQDQKRYVLTVNTESGITY
jgi:hypothetical protein